MVIYKYHKLIWNEKRYLLRSIILYIIDLTATLTSLHVRPFSVLKLLKLTELNSMKLHFPGRHAVSLTLMLVLANLVITQLCEKKLKEK